MTKVGFMWECSCGHTEYSELEPEECGKCGNINTFMQMPEEIIEERERDLAEEMKEEVLIAPKISKKSISAKKTKTRRKK